MANYSIIDIIYKKRDGHKLTFDEINYFITELSAGNIPDYQISAWLMAAFLKGLDIDETTHLTKAMAYSGKVLDLHSLGDYVVDKHSTGGVGDKATLIITPLIAACGLPIAKLSGRGLGYTGGTIDKLDAIPGFNTDIPTGDFIRQIETIGLAIGRQTQELAPADGILYALRDVTATVDSIPLIAASVLSKKIALGANIIILDVKYGAGAFMTTYEDALHLSETMVKIGYNLGKSITTLITGMEQPLGNAIGNSIEVIESIETLKGSGPKDLEDLCIEIAAYALINAHKASSLAEAREIAYAQLHNGTALSKLKDLFMYQKGNTEVLNDYSKLPTACHTKVIYAEQDGYITTCDAKTIAKACKLMGAGRDKKEDVIDLSIGVLLHKKCGDQVSQGEPLITLHYNNDTHVSTACDLLEKAYTTHTKRPVLEPLIKAVISTDSLIQI